MCVYYASTCQGASSSVFGGFLFIPKIPGTLRPWERKQSNRLEGSPGEKPSILVKISLISLIRAGDGLLVLAGSVSAAALSHPSSFHTRARKQLRLTQRANISVYPRSRIFIVRLSAKVCFLVNNSYCCYTLTSHTSLGLLLKENTQESLRNQNLLYLAHNSEEVLQHLPEAVKQSKQFRQAITESEDQPNQS